MSFWVFEDEDVDGDVHLVHSTDINWLSMCVQEVRCIKYKVCERRRGRKNEGKKERKKERKVLLSELFPCTYI